MKRLIHHGAASSGRRKCPDRGAATRYDHASVLNSFLEEFWIHGKHPNIWGRVEVLQRTAAELLVPGVAAQNAGRWVAAFTLGYTHTLAQIGGALKALHFLI